MGLLLAMMLTLALPFILVIGAIQAIVARWRVVMWSVTVVALVACAAIAVQNRMQWNSDVAAYGNACGKCRALKQHCGGCEWGFLNYVVTEWAAVAVAIGTLLTAFGCEVLRQNRMLRNL